MGQSDVRMLEALDLTQLTVEDVLSMKNEVMRGALLEVINGMTRGRPTHTSHGVHSNHTKTMQMLSGFDKPIVK